MSASKSIEVGDLVRWGWPRFHSDHRVGIVTRVDIKPRGAGFRVPNPRVRYVVQWFSADGQPSCTQEHVFNNEITRVTEAGNPWQDKTTTSK